MKTRLFDIWEEMQTSLWFVPAVMAAGAFGAALGIVHLEGLVPGAMKTLLYGGEAEAARELLSTIAGSMITVAGVTFSITIVALTLTTSQFGPRLLRNFMVDKSNQVVLGAFIGTFVYCLMVLREVRNEADGSGVPRLAVTFALFLAFANLGLLIYFFHHICRSIHAEEVVGAVYRDLEATIGRLFKQEEDYPLGEEQGEAEAADLEKDSFEVLSQRSGYLKAVEIESLLRLAVKKNLVIKVLFRAGDYVCKDMALAAVIGDLAEDTETEGAIRHAFMLGETRSPEQDVEFAIHQLVEVAMRALSPGINDPYTAMSCVDRLGDIVRQLNTKSFPRPRRYDKEGRLRLVLDVFDYDGILDSAFNQIRQCAAGNVAVSIRLLEALEAISRTAQNDEQKAAIRRHAEMVRRAVKAYIGEDDDINDVEERFEAVVRRL